MQFFYLIAAFLACTVAPSAAERKRCDQLPTDIECDARVQLEPYSRKVIMYKSTAAQQRCLNLQYVSNRNNNTQQATVTLWDSEDKYHIPIKVDVNAENTNWTLTDDSGVSLTYHKLVLNKERHWWCLYACDAVGEKIQHAICAVLDDKGKEELDAELAKNYPDKDLPLMEGQTLAVVYDKDCKTKSDKEVTTS